MFLQTKILGQLYCLNTFYVWIIITDDDTLEVLMIGRSNLGHHN